MAPEEFKRLGERCFGEGWQTTFAKLVGYNRATISQYASGIDAIPPIVVIALTSAADKLDNGVPIRYLKSVGELSPTARSVC